MANTGEGYTYDHILPSRDLQTRVVAFAYDHSTRARSGITDHSALILQLRLDRIVRLHTRAGSADSEGLVLTFDCRKYVAMLTTRDTAGAAWLKLDVLANGVEIDESVSHVATAARPIAVRKYFYNNPVWQDLSGPIPQELRVLGLIVGLNCYGESQWRLRMSYEDQRLHLDNKSCGVRYDAEPIRDLRLFAANEEAVRLANLYGGAALAFFSPRSCYFFSEDMQCGFCSLEGTASEATTLKNLLSEADVRETVRRVRVGR